VLARRNTSVFWEVVSLMPPLLLFTGIEPVRRPQAADATRPS
jgi:hypothetical protein